jgi:four helix bundle protein
VGHKSYEDLNVWQEAMLLADEVYAMSRHFPKEELYGLTQQIRRSVVSVASNIAEGSGRHNYGEFYQFVGIASGSLAELKTQLLITKNAYPQFSENIISVIKRIDTVGKMLNGLKKSLYEQRKAPVTSNQ